MDDLRCCWEVPSIAHFCSLFRNAFDLTDFDIEDLEESLLESQQEGGSDFIRELLCKLLNGCYGRTDISAANYDLYVKDVIKYKWEGVDSPIHEKSSFGELTLREKVELMHAVCEYRLDAEDVTELLKGFEGDNMRVEPLGKDKDGGTYWYFYGSRLYKEDPLPKTEFTKEEKRAQAKKKRLELHQKKKEEKLKKKKEKEKQKALKKLDKKKSVEEKVKKEKEDDSQNIRRSGRIKLRQLEQADKDSDTSDSSSTTSEESEESTEEEEEEEESEPAQVEEKKGKKITARNKTPVKKGQQAKGLSKSTSKKQPSRNKRSTATPNQKKIPEMNAAQSDPNIRRSGRLRGKQERPPPPPKFDSDTEVEINDDNDSGNESAFSDDDKSVKSEVSKHSTTSSITRGRGRPRKVPISKINLNQKFSEAADDDADDIDDITEEDPEQEVPKEDGEVTSNQSTTKAAMTASGSKEAHPPDTDTDDTITEEMDEQVTKISGVPERKQDEKSKTQESVNTVEPVDEHQSSRKQDTDNHTNEKVETDCGNQVNNSIDKEEVTCDVQTDKRTMDVEAGDISEQNIAKNSKDNDAANAIESEQIKEQNMKSNACESANDGIAEIDTETTPGQGNCTIDQVKEEPMEVGECHTDDNVDEDKNDNEVKTEESKAVKNVEKEATEKDESSDIKTEETYDSNINSIKKSGNEKSDEEKDTDDENETDTDIKPCVKGEKQNNENDNVKEEKLTDVDDVKKDIKNDVVIKKDVKEEKTKDDVQDLKPALQNTSKPAVPPKVSDSHTRWHLVCSNLDDWVNLAEWFKDSAVRSEKALSKIISEDFLPVLPEIVEAREKERRRRLQELEVRRSQRITYKQREKMEQEKILAQALAEEEKAKLQAEEERKLKEEQQRLEDENRLREERVRAREERSKRLSMREERARLIAEGREIPPELIYTGTQKYRDDEDSDDSRCDLKDEEDYQNLTKVVSAMKIHKDCWPFLEPVTDEVAPGYSEIIKRPMDISKIEQKIEKREYRSSAHFLSDFKLMFNNCKRFNGPDSEFTECARSMETMLKKYAKRFMSDHPSDSYYEDKDFHISNMRGAGLEKKYRPKRAASSRALQTVKKALDTDEEESSDEEELEPIRKRPREFPAKTLSHQSQMLQEMIEMKRQREKRLAASSLQNHKVIVRGQERTQVTSPSGGVMIIPKDELPPTGVLRLAATREIKRKVDPQSFCQKVQGRDSSLNVLDGRRTGAKPPKTIRIVAASPTLSGQASVKETAETVKVSSDGYLIIGGKNSGIKVSENTKIVIQPPASQGGTPGQATTMPGSKEIVLKKLPAAPTSEQSPNTTVQPKQTPNPDSSPGQPGLVAQKPTGIITAAGSPVVQRQSNPNSQSVHQQLINKVLASSGILSQNQQAVSPELQKKQNDIAQRITILNQQKRKLMQQKQLEQTSQVAGDGVKVMKLDNSTLIDQNQAQGSGPQTIEERLREPGIENQLGAVTKDVVSSVNIASDILDTYYSVLNKRGAEEVVRTNIPSTVLSDNVGTGTSHGVTNSLRNKLLSTRQPESSPARNDNIRLAQTNVNVIANGPTNIPANVTSNTMTSQDSAREGSISASFPSASYTVSNSATIVSRPKVQPAVQAPVTSVVVSCVNTGNKLNPGLAGGPVSIQTVVNSTRNLAGGTVQINLPVVVSAPATSLPVALTNITLPPQNPATNVSMSMLAPMPASATFNSAVSNQQSLNSTVSPIEALFSSDTGSQPVSIQVNPMNDSTLHGSVGPVITSPVTNNRLNLFDIFEGNQTASAPINNSMNSGLVNVSMTDSTHVAETTEAVQSVVTQQNLPQQQNPMTGTANFGSPLKTMSIMEALKSKLNPAKVIQTSESPSPVSPSTVPKIPCSALTHCMVELSQAHRNSHANTCTQASIACCSTVDLSLIKNEYDAQDLLIEPAGDRHQSMCPDVLAETGYPTSYENDTEMRRGLNDMPVANVSLDQITGHEVDRVTRSVEQTFQLNSSVGTSCRHKGIKVVKSEKEQFEGLAGPKCYSLIDGTMYGANAGIVTYAKDKRYGKERGMIKVCESDNLKKEELMRVNALEVETESMNKDGASVSEMEPSNLHAVQSWTELAILKDKAARDAAGGDGNEGKKDDTIYFRLSDTVPRSSVSTYTRGRKRGSKYCSQYGILPCVGGLNVTKPARRSRGRCGARRSRSLHDNRVMSRVSQPSRAGYVMENDAIKYVMYQSNDGDTVVKCNDGNGLRTVNINQVDHTIDKREEDLEEYLSSNVPGSQRRALRISQTNRCTLLESPCPEQNSTEVKTELQSLLSPPNALNELGSMRLSQKIKTLSGDCVYKLQFSGTCQKSREHYTHKLSTENNQTSHSLRMSLSDGCLGRSSLGTDVRYYVTNPVNSAVEMDYLHTPTPQTSCENYSLDSSLTCDEEFFTKELTSNPFLFNIGDGDDNIDHDLEKIQDDIFELQDKYLAHSTLPTRFVGQETSVRLNCNASSTSNWIHDQGGQNLTNSMVVPMSVNTTELNRNLPFGNHMSQTVNMPGVPVNTPGVYGNRVVSINLHNVIQQDSGTKPVNSSGGSVQTEDNR